ncbi:MAG: hypothetical protein V2J02_19310, partial [Pseudomonadales bacterium]|nr:hypothetical protein [Pseudomonadales bacterium]
MSRVTNIHRAHEILGGDYEQMTTTDYVRRVMGKDPAENPDPFGAGWGEEDGPWRLIVFPCGA